MTADAQPPDAAIRRLEYIVEMLRSPVMRGGTVHPPVGTVADFLLPEQDADLTAQAGRDELPLPANENREGYFSSDHIAYWRSGLDDFDRVVRAAAAVGCSGRRVYDFGGSTGRLFRHFFCQDRSWEVWSSDFKVASHEWNQQHMPQDIRVFLNSFLPHLPIPDQHFDVIMAFSVFTHIDDLESGWLLELRRVLRPRGLLYVTIHDEAFWDQKPDRFLTVLQQTEAGLDHSSPFPGPRRAYHFRTDSYYSCNTFHSRDYVRKQWGRFFDVAEIRPLDATGGQCAVWLTYDE